MRHDVCRSLRVHGPGSRASRQREHGRVVPIAAGGRSSEGAAAAVLLEALSCASYVVAFLQVFDRAPFRVGARVALSEEAFGAAVSLGGVGSLAVGGWLMRARRARSD